MGYLSHRVRPDQIKPGDHVYTWRIAFTYSHHGIYAGRNKVIHFNPTETSGSNSGRKLSSSFPSSCSKSLSELSQPKNGTSCDDDPFLDTYTCGLQHSRSGVIVSCLSCFIGNGSLYLYQYAVSGFVHGTKIRGGTCTMAPSDPPEDVVARAIYLWRNGFLNYNLFRSNCEDFALYCKTGLLVSGKSYTGTGSSGQVNILLSAPMLAYLPAWLTAGAVIISPVVMAGTVVAPPVGFVVAGVCTLTFGTVGVIGGHFLNRYGTDIGVRYDAKKTPVEDVRGG